MSNSELQYAGLFSSFKIGFSHLLRMTWCWSADLQSDPLAGLESLFKGILLV